MVQLHNLTTFFQSFNMHFQYKSTLYSPVALCFQLIFGIDIVKRQTLKHRNFEAKNLSIAEIYQVSGVFGCPELPALTLLVISTHQCYIRHIQGGGTMIYSVFHSSSLIKVLTCLILALTLDQEYNFTLTFDQAATLNRFDLGVECINS